MLAKELGMKERNIIIPELGMQVELTPDTIKVSGMVQAGSVLIDGTGLGEKDSNVIRDRLLLSQDGVCVVVATLSSKSGRLVREPDIISRGFVYQDEASDIIKEAKDFIYDKLSDLDLKAMDKAEIRASIRKVSTSFFFKHTKRKPVILSVIVEAE